MTDPPFQLQVRGITSLFIFLQWEHCRKWFWNHTWNYFQCIIDFVSFLHFYQGKVMHFKMLFERCKNSVYRDILSGKNAWFMGFCSMKYRKHTFFFKVQILIYKTCFEVFEEGVSKIPHLVRVGHSWMQKLHTMENCIIAYWSISENSVFEMLRILIITATMIFELSSSNKKLWTTYSKLLRPHLLRTKEARTAEKGQLWDELWCLFTN